MGGYWYHLSLNYGPISIIPKFLNIKKNINYSAPIFKKFMIIKARIQGCESFTNLTCKLLSFGPYTNF